MNWITDLPRFGLLWLIGVYFRLPVFAASALAPRIARGFRHERHRDRRADDLPVLMLAVAALAAGRFASRFGARTTVLAGLLLAGLASAGLGLAPDVGMLLLATAVMGLGITAMRTVTPALVRDWTPARIALGSAVYLNGMVAGEFIGAGLTLALIVPLAGGDWRLSFILWSLPALVVAGLLILPRTRRGGTTAGNAAAEAAPAPAGAVPRPGAIHGGGGLA